MKIAPVQYEGNDMIPFEPSVYTAAEPFEPSAGLIRIWHAVHRSRYLLAAGATAGCVLGLLAACLQTPLYQARATLELENVNENFLNLGDLNPTSSNAATVGSDVQTQSKVLESRALLERVAGRLTTRYPGIEEAGSFRRLIDWAAPPAHPDTNAITKVNAASKTARVKTFINSRIVEISCDSSDPALAKDYVNTWAAEYAKSGMEGRWDAIQRTESFLTGQIDGMRAKLEKSEDQLQRYAVSAGMLLSVDRDGHGTVAESSLLHVQEELSKAQADRVSRQARFEMIRTTPAESVPEIVEDKTFLQADEKLADLHRQLADLNTSLTPAHYKVQRVQAQIAEVEDLKRKLSEQILARISSEYRASLRREQLLTSAYENEFRKVTALDSRSVRYNVLKQEVDTSRQLYESLLKKVKEVGIASAVRSGGVRVVDPALLPESPYKPSKPLMATLGSLLGFGASLGLVAFGDSLRKKIRKPGETEKFLNLPELGIIPARNSFDPHWRHSLTRGLNRMLPGRAHSLPTASLGVEEWGDQFSIVAEAFRTVLTSIRSVETAVPQSRVLVISSPQPGEGKTTVATNLAVALAEANQRVLLIDADIRRPRVHACFQLSNDFGLVDLLHYPHSLADVPLEALCTATVKTGVSVLTGGTVKNPGAPLLYSDRLEELLLRFRREFDVVLVDTPPMLHLADARIVGRLADAVILVLAANQTTRESALQAQQMLRRDRIHVLGTVLNSVEIDADAACYKAYATYGAVA